MGQIFRSERRVAATADPAVMAEQVLPLAPASDAEALRLLRASFPDCPLTARVAALALLAQRQTARAA